MKKTYGFIYSMHGEGKVEKIIDRVKLELTNLISKYEEKIDDYKKILDFFGITRKIYIIKEYIKIYHKTTIREDQFYYPIVNVDEIGKFFQQMPQLKNTVNIDSIDLDVVSQKRLNDANLKLEIEQQKVLSILRTNEISIYNKVFEVM